jgi:hypothetical protein
MMIAALLVAALLIVTLRRYKLNKLARTAMIASAFGLYLCGKFSAHAYALSDQLTIYAVSIIMMSLAFTSWRERKPD